MDVENTNSFTNHSGNVNFKGQDYFFYHTGWLNGGSGFKRSIAVEYLTFNDDGTIQQIKPTRKGVAPVATLNPLELQEAETFNNCRGITVNGNAAKGVNVEFHANNDSVAVRNADFGEDPVKSVTLRLASTRGGRIYVRLDKNVSTSICNFCEILFVYAAIYGNLNIKAVFFAEFFELGDFIECIRNETLPAKARVDAHHENQINQMKNLGKK